MGKYTPAKDADHGNGQRVSACFSAVLGQSREVIGKADQ